LRPQVSTTADPRLFTRQGEEGAFDPQGGEHPPQAPIATRHSPECRCHSCLAYDAWVDGYHTKRNVESLEELVRESVSQTFDEVQGQGHDTRKQVKSLTDLVRETAGQTIDKLQLQGVDIRVQVKSLKQLIRDSNGDTFDEVRAQGKDLKELKVLTRRVAAKVENLDKKQERGEPPQPSTSRGATRQPEEEDASTWYQILQLFEEVDKKLNYGKFPWPEAGNRDADEFEEVVRAHVALRSAIDAKDDYWQSVVHLQRFISFAYAAHRKNQGLPLRFVQVAKELTKTARFAFFGQDFKTEPVKGSQQYWWNDIEYLEKHLARLERHVGFKGGEEQIAEDAFPNLPDFGEKVGKKAFLNQKAKSLAKAAADWSDSQVRDPQVKQYVEYLESALKLGKVAGDTQREEAKRRRKDSDLELLFKAEPATPEEPQSPGFEPETPEELRSPVYEVFDDGRRRSDSVSLRSAVEPAAGRPLSPS